MLISSALLELSMSCPDMLGWGLTLAEHTYDPLSLVFRLENVTDVSCTSRTPCNSETITLLSLSVSEECPLHWELIVTRESTCGISSMTHVKIR